MLKKCNVCGEKIGAHRGYLEQIFLIAKSTEEFQNSPLGKTHLSAKFGKSYYCKLMIRKKEVKSQGSIYEAFYRAYEGRESLS